MEPVKFSGMNAVYKAPGCDDLPAFKDQKDGVICVTSCWRPSREELDILNSGGCVCLSVIEVSRLCQFGRRKQMSLTRATCKCFLQVAFFIPYLADPQA